MTGENPCGYAIFWHWEPLLFPVSDLRQQQIPLLKEPALLVENQVAYAACKPLSKYRGVPPCWSPAEPAEWQIYLPLGSAGAFTGRGLSRHVILPLSVLWRQHVGTSHGGL